MWKGDRMATSRDPDVVATYHRMYDRYDILAPSQRWRVALGIVLAWALCGAVNYQFLAGGIKNQRQRALRSVLFGPTFGPLKVGTGRTQVKIGEVTLPIQRAGLIGLVPVGLAGMIMLLGQETRDRRAKQQRMARKHAAAQGRPQPQVVQKKLAVTGSGIPLGLVEGRAIGIKQGEDAGHIAVIAPTRSGKGLHLTEVLLQWAGPRWC